MPYAAAIMIGMFVFFVPFLDFDAHALHNKINMHDHITFDYDVYPILNFKSNEITFALDRDVSLQSIDPAMIKVSGYGSDGDVSLKGAAVSNDEDYGRYVIIKLTDENAAALARISDYHKLDLAEALVSDDRGIDSKHTMYVITAVGTYVKPGSTTDDDDAKNNTAPVIVLSGPASLDVTRGSVYDDAGATCSDISDAGYDVIQTVVDTVDTAALGTYAVTYRCTDALGNVATPVTRTVFVVDGTLESSHVASLTAVQTASDSITLAWPTFSGAASYNIQWEPAVLRGKPVYAHTHNPNYTITGLKPDTSYEIDVTGNPYNRLGAPIVVKTLKAGSEPQTLDSYTSASSHKNGQFADTTAPEIRLNGAPTVYALQDEPYSDDGASCTDDVDGVLSATVTNSVDVSVLGSYAVSYSCTDSANNTAHVSRTVIVQKAPDVVQPLLQLNGHPSVIIHAGSAYSDAGSTCRDDVDGVIQPSVLNPVDADTPGTYTITYNCSDSSGNPAVPVHRTVVVQNAPDIIPPMIRLAGSPSVVALQYDTYVDAGATCTDDVDGVIPVTVSNPVDTAVPGTYSVTYECMDSAGNFAMPVHRSVLTEHWSQVFDMIPPDTVPELTILSVGPDHIIITWPMISGASNYAVTLVSDAQSFQVKIPDTSYALTGLSPSASYLVYVTAGSYVSDIPTVVTLSKGSDPLMLVPMDRPSSQVDVDIPVITLLGQNPTVIAEGTKYDDMGATCMDYLDGDLPIGVDDTVDPYTPGNYTVTFTCTDTDGNTATPVSRTIVVGVSSSDSVAPVITMNGQQSVSVVEDATYADAGATCADDVDGSITVTVSNPVDTSAPGRYAVTYTCTDSSGNHATPVDRTVTVVRSPDIVAPVITMNGQQSVSVVEDATYADAGATCTDDVDGAISVTVSNPVDTAAPGRYAVTYTCTDSSGNHATPVDRTVTVEQMPDLTAPVITMNGQQSVSVVEDATYADAGATCTDDVDGAISVTVSNPVDTAAPGRYAVTYTCTDSSGNHATPVDRTVTVEQMPDLTAPVITMNGQQSVSVVEDATYADAGATCTDDVDGAISVTVSNPVDTAAPGRYVVTYTCTDSSGNHAIPMDRTVTVEQTPDLTAPVIIMNGQQSVSVVEGATYTDAGATCTDDVDGAIIPTVTGTVDATQKGNYTITYACQDTAGNVAIPVARNVTVVHASSSHTVDPALIAQVRDYAAETIHGNAHVERWNRVLAAFGVADHANPITAAEAQEMAKTFSANRWDPIVVELTALEASQQLQADTVPPVITLVGQLQVSVPIHTSYADAGATCTDDVDRLVTAVAYRNTVNVTAIGTYIVTYGCTDAAGNNATDVSRTVNVVDVVPPVISLNGNATVTIFVGATYTDAGATCTDDVDGVTSIAVPILLVVDTSVPSGNYSATYECTDLAGNSAVPVVRMISVIEPPQPPKFVVDSALIDAVRDYASETHHGKEHVERWYRVLSTFDAIQSMTLQEAREMSDAFLPARWNPVIAELENKSASRQSVVDAVKSYASETHNGAEHVNRWYRVLESLDAIPEMTATEAQALSEQYHKDRWEPVVNALRALKG